MTDVLTEPRPSGREASPDDAGELLVGTRKGLVVLRGRRGGPMEVVARKFSGITCEFAIRDPRIGPVPRVGHPWAVRAPDLHRRRSARRVDAVRRAGLSGGRGDLGRADLGRSEAGARSPVCCGRAWPRPRCSEARTTAGRGSSNEGLWNEPSRPRLAAGRGRHVPELDLHLARRPDRGWRWASRRPGCGSPTTAGARGGEATGHRRPVPPRGGARGRGRPLRAQHAPGAAASPTRSYCSSTAACTEATTPVRPGTTSGRPACPPTSGSRW